MMRELNVCEIEELNGGVAVAGAFITGAGAAALTGAPLGLVGIAVGVGVYSISFGLTYLMMQ